MKYPEGNTGAVGEQVDFAYYPQMALKRVVGVGTVPYLDEAAYDEMGRMVTRKLGSLPETTYTYYPWTIDANAEGYQQGGRLKTAITGSLQNLAYTYDPNGNILSITDGRGGGDAPLTFGYDAADRLDWMNKGGQLQDNPDYDATTGNLIQKGQSNPQPANPAIALGYIDNSLSNLDNTKPHAVKSMGGNQYGYDANGNMIKRLIGGVTYTLTYNAENRLVGYAGGSITASFVYEGDGKRVKGTVNGVVTTYVGNHYEVQGTTTRKYYFAGTQRIAVNENGTLYHFLSDHLGSTAITVEDDGDFHGELRYSAWGETREEIGETPTTRRYTGQAQEELLGIYFFEARWLDPGLGRFLSPDTLVPDPYNSLDWDRYAFVRGNPINSIDPTGHATFKHLFYDADVGKDFYPPFPKLPGRNDVYIDGKYIRDPANTTYERIGEFYKGQKWDPSSLLPGILYSEFGNQLTSSGMDDAIVEAVTRMYNEHCSGGTWSAECINGFWSYFEGSRTEKGRNIVNNFNSGNIVSYIVSVEDNISYFKNLGKMMVLKQVTINGGNTPVTGGLEWNRPYHWCNLCEDVTAFRKIWDRVSSNWFVVLTPNQKWVACGNKFCNLTYTGCK